MPAIDEKTAELSVSSVDEALPEDVVSKGDELTSEQLAKCPKAPIPGYIAHISVPVLFSTQILGQESGFGLNCDQSRVQNCFSAKSAPSDDSYKSR